MRLLAALLLVLITRPSSLHAQECAAEKTALVLSGGGARGLAHVGVLRALDSLGLRPDIVIGTSMGAIVGAMYSSGYSGAQIDSLTRVLPLASLFRTYEPRSPQALGVLPPLLVWEQGDRGFTLQSAAVREPEVNALLNALMLQGNLLARGNFDSLPIPFRAVATGLSDRSLVVLASGDLARAVRASFAIPLIFQPEQIDGRFLGDGGLSANIPVSVARAEGATRVIVSDVTAGLPDSIDLRSPLVMATHLVDLLFVQPPDPLGPDDIVVRARKPAFISLDFSSDAVARTIEEGVAAAAAALRSLPCPPAPVPHVDPVIPAHLTGLRVQGAGATETLVMRSVLGLAESDHVELGLLQGRLLRLGSSEIYDAVWLHPRGEGDSVRFEVAARYAARRHAAVGLVYDNDLGGRMWLGMLDRKLLGSNLEWGGALLLGELRTELVLGARRNYLVGRRVIRPTVTAAVAAEDVRQFDAEGAELESANVRERVGFVGVERAFGRGWGASWGVEARGWSEPARRSARSVGGAVRISQVGRSSETLFRSEAVWTDAFRRFELAGIATAQIERLRIRPRVRYTYGERLPLQLMAPLGGNEGFPGLHIGDRRGDREMLFGLLLAYPLKGPLMLRIEGLTGNSAIGGRAVPRGHWLSGVRAGLGIDTPLGPMRFEYGLNGDGQSASFVRIGRWF
jgi:NTE family protein